MGSSLLKGANIVNVADGTVSTGIDLRITEGIIKEMGRNLAEDDSTVIDLTGEYLIPGLIDTHVHLKSKSQLGIMLAYGVTTVRNMSGHKEIKAWQKSIDTGELSGPRIYSTGPITNGVKVWDGFRIVTTPEQAEMAVLEDINMGWNYIKTYPDIPRAAFIRLMEVAREHNIKVVGHGSNTVSAQELINLGYFSLEHVSRLPPGSDEDVVKIAQSGMWYVPTLTALTNVDGYLNRGVEVDDFAYADYVEASLIEDWRATVMAYRADQRFKTFSLSEFSRITKLFKQHSNKIVLGTDIGVPGTVPGISTHGELELLVELGGFTPQEALLAATSLAAEVIGVQDQLGVLAEGKAADIVILGANPLDSVTHSRAIGGVVKAGIYYDVSGLKALLRESQQMIVAEQSYGRSPT